MLTSTNVDTRTLLPNETQEIQRLIENLHFELPSNPPQSLKANDAADYTHQLLSELVITMSKVLVK
jgi:hypothetical protein